VLHLSLPQAANETLAMFQRSSPLSCPRKWHWKSGNAGFPGLFAEALGEGISREIIDIIKHRKDTGGLDEADAIVIELGRQIFGARKVTSATFARALRQFGRRTLVDLVALIGNYAGTAALLTAFDMQLDPSQPPPLPQP
jgi:hypothetical protein